MNKSTSTRLGQILLDKGLITAAQLDIAIKEQQKRRQLLDPFDENLGVNSSLGEVLIELGFIDRLQLRRGLNWQLMLRKMAIVMSFCAPLMAVSSGAAAASGPSLRPTFTAESSSAPAKANPSFTKTSSSVSSAKPVNTVSSVAKTSSSSSSRSSKANVSSLDASSTSSKAPTSTELKIAEVSVVLASYDYVQLNWAPDPGSKNIIGYKIYRDQVEIDALYDSRDYYDFNVAADKTYLYGISAGDSLGNWSPIKSIFVQTEKAPEGIEVVTSSSSTSSVASSQMSVSSSSLPNSSLASSSSSAVSSAASSVSSKAVTSSSASSKPVSSSSAISSIKSSVSSASVASSSVSSVAKSSIGSSSVGSSSSSGTGVKTSIVTGPASFNWDAPTLRENGNVLDITELGGYEFRYRKVSDTTFTYVTINDAWKNYHNFTWLEGTFIFQVAAFDKNGLYSNFVDLAPH